MSACYFLGALIIACARSNRHLIALERDTKIFDGVLAAYKANPRVTEQSGESMFDSDSDTPPPKKGQIYMGAQQFRPYILLLLTPKNPRKPKRHFAISGSLGKGVKNNIFS